VPIPAPLASFISRVNAAAQAAFRYDLEIVVPRGALLSRTPDSQWQPPCAAFAESPYPAEARPHSRQRTLRRQKAGAAACLAATRFTTLNRRGPAQQAR